MKKKTAESDGNDDIDEAFKFFDTKNDGQENMKFFIFELFNSG